MGLLNTIDTTIALKLNNVVPPKKGLISILIHGLFKDKSEVHKSNADPQQSITWADLEKIITFYQERDYEFLTQDDLTYKLKKNKKYCFLTFDDGYFNNVNALKFLEKYNVPATFYCCTAHITEQKNFWWDVFYREKKKTGINIQEIRRQKIPLKNLKYNEIEEILINEFGKDAFKPVDDTDRPLTENELKDFSSHPLVQIGNHTHNHIILTNHTSEEIVTDIKMNQDILYEITGQRPTSIAYPNGNLNKSQISEIKELGLTTGFTVEKGKNYLPIKTSDEEIFSLKRYTPWHYNLNKTLALSETDFHIKNLIKN